MKNSKILISLIIVSIILIILLSYNYKKQNIYLERIILANELDRKLDYLNDLTILLEELPFNNENMDLISKLNDHRNFNLMHEVQKVQNSNYPNYYYFLINFDVEYYQIIYNLEDKIDILNKGELLDIIENIKLVRGALLNSIEWGHGGDNRGHHIYLEFEQEDMVTILEELRSINRKINEY
ncbi:MAG: hypothetical protein JJT76_19650 [Clostridiaceae bacterium]|nr:hypothetical protein [Clostridiaceae bacterium]